MNLNSADQQNLPFIQLAAISLLKDNWDSYGSPPINAKICKAAEDLIKCIDGMRLDGLPLVYISPVSGGGVQLEWCKGTRELELEFVAANKIEWIAISEECDLDEGTCRAGSISRIRRLLEWLIQG